MIILNVSGGIGNQMFGLAYSLKLVESSDRRVYIVVRDQELVTRIKDLVENNQKFENLKVVSRKKFIWFLDSLFKLHEYLAQRLNINFNSKMLPIQLVTTKEPWDVIDTVSLSTRKFLVVQGYFQSVQVLGSLKNDAVSLLCRIVSSSFQLKDSKNETADNTKVGVHIRRGDYVSIPEYGCLSHDYFLEQIESITTENLSVLVSSDSEETCKFFVEQKGFETLNPRQNSPLYTMNRLSNSHIFIMSNSTFSFWIGWYVSINGGKVFAPEPWFKTTTVPTSYLYLDSFEKRGATFE